MQDAAERALARWSRDGIPDNPAAWLTTTAHRRAVDILRRRRTEIEKLREVQGMAERWPVGSAGGGETSSNGSELDDRLVLLFTCCHPALPPAGQVALTCKTVAGLSTRQVARAFLVSEATMGQRLLRVRNKIAHSGIGFTPPEPHRLPERVAGVLAVIYLVFNEAYVASEGAADDPALAGEAIELAALTARLLPRDDEARSLHALLLLQHSRRAARVDAAGDLVPMEEQDRTLWDRQLIAGGLAALETARAGEQPAGPYRLQAEIAALHTAAPDPGSTNWAAIVEQYDRLLAIQPTPVVALNRAIAVGFRDGPNAGLAALDRVGSDPRLADYHLLPATRADLLRRAGRTKEAEPEYRRALARARTDAERRFLTRRLAEFAG